MKMISMMSFVDDKDDDADDDDNDYCRSILFARRHHSKIYLPIERNAHYLCDIVAIPDQRSILNTSKGRPGTTDGPGTKGRKNNTVTNSYLEYESRVSCLQYTKKQERTQPSRRDAVITTRKSECTQPSRRGQQEARSLHGAKNEHKFHGATQRPKRDNKPVSTSTLAERRQT